MLQSKTSLVVSFLFLLMVSSCTPTPAATARANPTVTSIARATSSPCTSISAAPTPGPDAPSLFPPITAADHVRGPEDAIVTIMVYGDLQDGNSGLFDAVVNRLLEAYPGDVRFISRIFPLVGRNDKAVYAAQAVEAAHLQGKFWEMHDLLYARQADWVNISPEDFAQWTAAQASALGMDGSQYQADVKSEAVARLVRNNFETAQKFGPFAVPLIVINGDIYLGPQDFGSLNDIIQLVLLGRRQFTECPPFFVNKTRQYIATLHTEKGDVVIQLFADKTPFTVNSFIFLARNGWYDNNTFFRVVPELFALTGDPSGTGRGVPGYYTITEILPELKFDKPGMVAMVNSGLDTSGGQFFINYTPMPQFDGQYTIFGEVLSGMDVLEALASRDPQPGVETPPGDKLLGIEIEEK